MQPYITVLVAVLIGFGVYGLRRVSVLKTANETIELLNSRIGALEQRDAQRELAYKALENKCAVLQEMVTNAAEVHAFRTDYVASVNTLTEDHQRIIARVDHATELLTTLIMEQRKG